MAHANPNRGGGGPNRRGGPNRGGGPNRRGGGGDGDSGDDDSGGDGDRGHGHGHGDGGLSNICNNLTVAGQFPAAVQAVITTLQSNGSFAAVLASKAQEIEYVTNATNTALISTNCTAYFDGFNTARETDQEAQKAAQQYYKIAGDLLKQAIQALTGGSKIIQ